MFKRDYCLGFLCLVFVFTACELPEDESVRLIPAPSELSVGHGVFRLDTGLFLVSDLDSETTSKIQNRLESIVNFEISTVNQKDVRKLPNIHFKKNDEEENAESYILKISNKKIEVLASQEKGYKNALNTLEQLLYLNLKPLSDNSTNHSWDLPVLTIKDSPKFEWRGLMLDCSRTFIPIPEIKKYIDVLSLYKMNVLHLHLTDDQGWRLEIKKYPELTDLCSESDPKYSNDRGGYYSQSDMKDLISYAGLRNVTIVPEIEMPGHTREVFAAFPQLSCFNEVTRIFPFFSGPGITPEIFCAGKEETFEFLENVLNEVCDLFPSEFIHIGGDEAPKVHWDKCPDCQSRIKEEGLTDSHELQSYFIQRIEKILNKKGKKLIGWDEILEGGLAENAAVMSWRGINGGIAAAEAKHSAVMSPTSHCYFDYSHGTTSVEQVYEYNPIPDELDKHAEDFILGAQANFWSHIDRQAFAMQRQIFPRIIALSEKLWSGEGYDYDDFAERLDYHYPILDSLDVNYYKPEKIIVPNDSLDFAAKLNLEGYGFDFHGFKGAEFNYQGMACKVVIPDSLAEGHPWIWRARFWGHQPQLDLALLKLGYHVVYCDVGNLYGNEVAVDRWNRFYALMQRAGLAKKGFLEGMSRGGLIIYNWALANPDKVNAIYADAPVLNGFSWPGGIVEGKRSDVDWMRFKHAYEIKSQRDSASFKGNPIHTARQIAKLNIPLIHVCGEADVVVPVSQNTNPFAKEILRNGGTIKVIMKPGIGHHPHSLEDPTEILNFLLKHKQ